VIKMIKMIMIYTFCIPGRSGLAWRG